VKSQPVKQHPIIGACGLDCGLCQRYHSGGTKPCPGCCGQGFWDNTPSCGIITCCVKQRGLEVCGQCNELEYCPRVMRNLEAAKRRDTVLSYQTMPSNLELIHKRGLKVMVKRQQDKVDFLRLLIKDYNDGRSKGFYCLAVQLLPLDGLKASLAEAQAQITPDMMPKDRTKMVRTAFGKLAEEVGVELKLRSGKSK
jgi:hypothetical protein